MDITTVGEILIDLTQTGVNEAGIPLLAANPGGAPANVAVAASRLGAQTAFMGKVGNDGFGQYLRQVLEENHVDAAHLLTSNRSTTMAVVTVDQTGERTFQFVRGADRELVPTEVSPETIRETKILHFGSVSLTDGPARNSTIFAAKTAHEAGILVSYDPNYRSALWPDEDHAIEWMRMPLPLVDIIKISEEELPLLTGTADLEEGVQILEEQDISLILVTLGGDGSLCRWKGETFRVPGVSVKIADTNGAGDTFLGAVLSRLSFRRGGTNLLEDLTRGELEDILNFANHAAALTCSRSGAIPAMPVMEEVEEFMQ